MPDSDALTQLVSASQSQIDLDSLVRAACKSFELIERWDTARTEHQAVVPIVLAIKEQAGVYYQAIDLSIQTAQDGYNFSQDSEQLCDFLLDPTNTTEELQEFVRSMQEMASRAYEDAKIMSESFRSVRQSLAEIAKGIPAEVAKVQEQEQRARNAKAVAERRATQANLATGIATAVSTAAGGALAIGFLFPPGLIFLPVILPVFAFVSGAMDMSYSKKAREREEEAHECVDALQELHRAAADLSELEQRVDLFANWWLQMQTMLSSIESKIGQLRAERILKLRVKTVKNGWVEAKDRYLEYKIKIAKLQDLYPSSRLQTSDSPNYLGEAATQRKRMLAIKAA